MSILTVSAGTVIITPLTVPGWTRDNVIADAAGRKLRALLSAGVILPIPWIPADQARALPRLRDH
jgi:hypothetical protein